MTGHRQALLRWLWAVVALHVLAATSTANAQGLSAEERQAAAEAAYDRGSAAYRGGDYDTAARWYETANELAPSANALIQAIRSHERARNVLRAATLATELTTRYDQERMRRYAEPVIERAVEVGFRIDVTCSAECQLTVDGEAEPRRTLYLRPDMEHTISAEFETGRAEERVQGGPGERREVAIEAPVATAEPDPADPERDPTGGPGGGGSELSIGGGPGGAGPRDEGGGLPPAIFYTGAILTVVAGGVLAWSAVDTLEAAEDYEDMPTQAKLDAGRDLERRTNILVGVTAGLGAVTLLLLALTDFGGDEAPAVETAFVPLPEGGLVLSAAGSLP